MCSEPGRVREHLEHVALGAVGCGRVAGLSTSHARASSQTRCHFSSIVFGSYVSLIARLRVQKSLSHERLVGSSRGSSPRWPPALGKKLLHCAHASTVPRRNQGRGGRARARRHAPRPSWRSGSGRRSSSTPRRRCARGARLFQRAVPDALVVYGTKAFPNVALMRLLAEEGLGADVSTLGELAFARACRDRGRAALVHGNNKSDEELRAAADGRRARRPRRARRARARRRRGRAPRPRPRHAGRRGRDARVDPHRPPRLQVRARRGRRARGASRAALARGLDVRGPARPRRLAARATSRAPAHDRAARRVRRPLPDELELAAARRSTSAAASGSATSRRAGAGGRGARAHGRGRGRARLARRVVWTRRGLIVEPGRALVGRAGVTLYRVGAVKRLAGDRTLRRDRRGHVRQPAAAALRRALHGRARRTAPTRSPTTSSDRGQALRVGRRPDRRRRAARAAPRRPDRRSRDRRLHARDGVELQRRPPARGGARRRTATRG